jgi:RNA polymerase primary sigma factor
MQGISDHSFKDINAKPLLTAKREKELGIIIRGIEGHKRDEALVELIESNLRLVAKEAIRYSNVSTVSLEELYNGGRSGLIRAAFDYDPDKYNTRFSTYATVWIRHGIRNVVHNSSPVKIPEKIINGAYRKRKALNSGKKLSEDELKKEINVTDSQMDYINKSNVTSFSLNMEIDSDGEGETTYSDIIPDQNAIIPGDIKDTDPRYDFLEDAMSELDDLSREIINSQIISESRIILSEIGIKYGVSAERIRQIKAKALSTLKQKITYKMSVSGCSSKFVTKQLSKNRKLTKCS